MKLKTLKEWNLEGRRIDRGAKAKGFNDNNEALFSPHQTWDIKEASFGRRMKGDGDSGENDSGHPMEGILQHDYCGGGR